jgi:hypothetical protein
MPRNRGGVFGRVGLGSSVSAGRRMGAGTQPEREPKREHVLEKAQGLPSGLACLDLEVER